MKEKRWSTSYMVRLAVLIAILFLLEGTGLGLIKTPMGLEITTLQIPVLVGAIVMGPLAGGILGGVFGSISFWECFGKSWFGAQLLAINPLGTFLTCIPTRILMGILCGLIFRALFRIDRTKMASFAVAGLSGALLNTLFFMSVLMAFFFHTDFIQQIAGGTNVLAAAVAMVGIQGAVEAVVCTVVGAAVAKALYHSMNKRD